MEHLGNEEIKVLKAAPEPELILNVDGGHLKTTEDQRSIEEMTAVVYRSESLKPSSNEDRHYISSKNCAASAKDDSGAQLVRNTVVAALKQGLTDKTHITALCERAENCWKVVEAFSWQCDVHFGLVSFRNENKKHSLASRLQR